MLVVMALFLTLMLIVSDIFLSVSVVQKKTIAAQQATNDLQYNLEQIVQTIRLNKINYEYYPQPINLPAQTLALLNDQGEPIIIQKTNIGCYTGVASCISQKIGKWGQAFIMSSNNINIESLNFYILPVKSPFVFSESTKKYDSDKQPQVTIVIRGKTIASNPADEKIIRLQTTVSSRYYER